MCTEYEVEGESAKPSPLALESVLLVTTEHTLRIRALSYNQHQAMHMWVYIWDLL